MVDLQLMTCTYKKFDMEKLPYVHMLRAVGVKEDKFYDCCLVYYN